DERGADGLRACEVNSGETQSVSKQIPCFGLRLQQRVVRLWYSRRFERNRLKRGGRTADIRHRQHRCSSPEYLCAAARHEGVTGRRDDTAQRRMFERDAESRASAARRRRCEKLVAGTNDWRVVCLAWLGDLNVGWNVKLLRPCPGPFHDPWDSMVSRECFSLDL